MVKLAAPANPNYCCTVVRAKNLRRADNSDNLQVLPMFGMQAIVDLSTQEGDLGIIIPAESQLSEEYCRANNLFSHPENNSDTTKKGYIEDNRRIRAIRLRGNRSDALFMPVSSIFYTGTGSQLDFYEGMEFDTLGDYEICRKYERKVPPHHGGMGEGRRKDERSRVDGRLMPEQFNIVNFFKVEGSVDPMAQVTLTQKLHGTSIRIGNIRVRRRLSWWERVARRFGALVDEYEYDEVYGSHHVIKDANNPLQQDFYGTDLWSSEGAKIAGLIPQNYVVYGELIGWVPATGAPIQSHYTYDCPPGTCKLYVYRVAIVNDQGVSCDLSWPAVKEFCQTAGLQHVPELTQVRAIQLSDILALFLDYKFSDFHWLRTRPVPLSPDSPCDEGVCIRIEGITPSIFKAKAPMFLQHETKALDTGAPDMEAEEAALAEVR